MPSQAHPPSLSPQWTGKMAEMSVPYPSGMSAQSANLQQAQQKYEPAKYSRTQLSDFSHQKTIVSKLSQVGNSAQRFIPNRAFVPIVSDEQPLASQTHQPLGQSDYDPSSVISAKHRKRTLDDAKSILPRHQDASQERFFSSVDK